MRKYIIMITALSGFIWVNAQHKLQPSLYFSVGTHYNLSYYRFFGSSVSPWMAQQKSRLNYHFGLNIHLPVSHALTISTGASFYRNSTILLRDNVRLYADIPSKVNDSLRWSEINIPINFLWTPGHSDKSLFIGLGPNLVIPFATRRNAYNKRWGFADRYYAEFYFNDTEERKNKPLIGFNVTVGKPVDLFKKRFLVDFTAYSDLSSRKLPSTYNFEAPKTYKFKNYFFSLSVSAYLNFWQKQQ